MNSFTVSTELPASTQAIYDAWLNGEEHGAFTQAEATASTEVGGAFTAHDGYINGINLELEDGRRILQTWRTTGFSETDPDSSLEVTLEPIPAGTRVTLSHWNIPEGQAESYESGWQSFYFAQMLEYFSGE